MVALIRSPFTRELWSGPRKVGDLAYLSQEIPTVPGMSYSLSLWLNSPDGITPNEFSVSWGGTTLCDYTNLPAFG